jgi:hypothetical protein
LYGTHCLFQRILGITAAHSSPEGFPRSPFSPVSLSPSFSSIEREEILFVPASSNVFSDMLASLARNCWMQRLQILYLSQFLGVVEAIAEYKASVVKDLNFALISFVYLNMQASVL